MTKTQNQMGGEYPDKLNESTTTGTGAGAGGLAKMGEALAAAGINLTTATTGTGRALGVEAMPIITALASCEQPAGPLLLAVQGQLDLAIATRSARKLAARMAGDGHEVSPDRLKDAIGAGCHALTCWRSGVTLQRGPDGADFVTASPDTGERLAARIAWRGCVVSLSDDTLGGTVPLLGGAEDDWLCAQALPAESRTERAARLFIERHARQRQALLVRRLGNVSGGRGRRAAAVEKVGNALALMLGGESLEQAALAAGFNGRERHSAGDTFLQAAKRLALVPGGFTARTRGRSEAGLSRVVPEFVRAYVPPVPVPVPPVVCPVRGRAGTHCGAACLAAAVVRSINHQGPSPARLAARAARGALRLESERKGWEYPTTPVL